MLCKPFSFSILSKRFSSLSSLPSPSPSLFFEPAKKASKSQNPSQRFATLFPLRQIKASLEIPQTTHVAKFKVSPDFLSESLKFAAKNGLLPQGKQLHSCIAKWGYGSQQSLQNQLINMYIKCGDFVDACNLFDEMPARNVVSWNTMLSGYISCGRFLGPLTGISVTVDADSHDLLRENLAGSNGQPERISRSVSHGRYLGPTVCEVEKNGLDLFNSSSIKLGLFMFKKMLLEMAEPNFITFISVLGACIGLNDIEFGKQLHCSIVKAGFSSNCFVGSALVDLYAKFGSVRDARSVFDKIPSKDLVLWNVMLSCYAFNDLGREAFGAFGLMRLEGIMGDDFTFSSLLNSCSNSDCYVLGKQIHGLIVRVSLDFDILVASALVDMYAKNGHIEDARNAFDGMSIRNVVSWTTMIVGYGQNGEGKEAMELFMLMLREGMKPDELTFASLLSSCAKLAAANEAVQLHAHVIKIGLGRFMSIGNALITAYAKCGCIAEAFESFRSISGPDLVTWTSMIGAYAFHGLAVEAVETFEMMLHEGLRPDRITFVGVLSACSHAGLLDEGLHYFDSMRKDHQIMPDSEHYTCLVDLLGRSGCLDEAHNILANMPLEPSANVLGAFISACKVCGNIRLAKWAAEMLFKLEPGESANYAIMSNIYATAESWNDVARVRKLMRDRSDFKVPGCSWTEIAGKVHSFVSCDKSHLQTLDIYAMLETVTRTMNLED